MGDDDGDGDAASILQRQPPKHPMARFNQATAPRMRGVIASGNAKAKELGEELLDKSCVGDVAAIKHLVAIGADPDFVDREEGWGGVTPLMNAATNGSRSAVMTLLVLGAALNPRDDNGWTALHRAAGKGHKAVVQVLVDAGADLSARDSSGAFLHRARVRGLLGPTLVVMWWYAVLRLCFGGASGAACVRAGKVLDRASPHRRVAGLTAKDWARFCGHEELVQLLTPTEKSEEEIQAELERLQVGALHTRLVGCRLPLLVGCQCLCARPRRRRLCGLLRGLGLSWRGTGRRERGDAGLVRSHADGGR